MKNIVAVALMVVAISGCGKSKVDKSDVDAALNYMANRTTICQQKLKAVEIDSTKIEGQSCEQNSCNVKLHVVIRFTPAVSRIYGNPQCGFYIGQYWTHPGFTAWLTEGAGNSLSRDLLDRQIYKAGNTVSLSVELKFKKYDTGWQFAQENY